MNPSSDFPSLLERELKLFFSAAMRQAFNDAAVTPQEVIKKWQYSTECHECWVIAENSTHHLLYCETGFGPDFRWSTQPKASDDLGTDGEWCAYLVEAFASTFMWSGPLPHDFELKGPGERRASP